MKIIENSTKNKNWEKRIFTNFCVIHHVAAKNYSFKQCDELHLKKGWHNIGYHFYVEKDGTIYTGRPINIIGAHCKGFNSESIGIAFEGNYEVEKDMPEEQFYAGQALLQMITFIYPNIEFLKHSEKVDTLCPGQFFPFYKMLDISTLDDKKKTNCVEIVAQKDEEIRLLREQLKRTESILEKNREYTEQIRKDYQEVVRRLHQEKADLENLLK